MAVALLSSGGSSPRRPGDAAMTLRVHAAGFIPVSRRFHSLARALADPFRMNTGTTPARAARSAQGRPGSVSATVGETESVALSRRDGALGDRWPRRGGQLRNPLVGGQVVGGHDLHQARERGNPEQVFPYLAGVDVGKLTHQERQFSRPADTLELPGHVADKGIALAGRQRDENDHRTRRVASRQSDHHRAVAVHVVARREAEIRRVGEFVLVDLVIPGNRPEYSPFAGLRRVSQLARIRPDGHLKLIEAAHVVPVGVRDQHAPQPAPVITASVELLAGRGGRLVGRARKPGLRVDVSPNAGTEARIDQEIALWVGNQDRRRGEGALVTERAALERKASPRFITAGWQLVDGHVRRWRGLREAPLPSARHGQRLHGVTSLSRARAFHSTPALTTSPILAEPSRYLTGIAAGDSPLPQP